MSSTFKTLRKTGEEPASAAERLQEPRAARRPVAAPELSSVGEPIGLPLELQPFLRAALSPGSRVAERFRLLHTKLRDAPGERPARCVGVVSATPGEGKSSAALGLAFAAAQKADRRVLLMEADLRNPSMEKLLQLEPRPGLSDWLKGSSRQLPLRRITAGFHLIVAGQSQEISADLLGGEQAEGLMKTLRQSFDFIVVDCPPLNPVADSVLLQSLLDGFVVVVRARWSSRDGVREALANLRPDAVLGFVLNDEHHILRRDGRKAYQGYYRSR